MKWTPGVLLTVLLIIAMSLAGTALGAQRQTTPPPAPPPQMPTIPPAPPAPPPTMAQASQLTPAMAAAMAQSTSSVDVYLLVRVLRAQDEKIAELEKRLEVLERRSGVKK